MVKTTSTKLTEHKNWHFCKGTSQPNSFEYHPDFIYLLWPSFNPSRVPRLPPLPIDWQQHCAKVLHGNGMSWILRMNTINTNELILSPRQIIVLTWLSGLFCKNSLRALFGNKFQWMRKWWLLTFPESVLWGPPPPPPPPPRLHYTHQGPSKQGQHL